MDFQTPQNGMYDPSSFIDPSAIANPQMNGTRAYPMSSIPQKRDSTGATLSLSRSQTPSQQPQFGFPQQQNFANTPSPTMQNQNFAPAQLGAQRMQTASPAQNPHAPQMSPMGFQNSPMNPSFNQNASGQFPVQSVQLSQNLQSRQQEAQRQYAMRLQAQAQQQHQMGNLAASNMAAQQRHQGGQMPGAMPGAMPGGMQQQGMQQGMQPGMIQAPGQQQQQNPQFQYQQFLKNVSALMSQHRRPFNPQPTVAGRPINLQQLYTVVLRYKGHRVVTQSQAWPKVSHVMNIPPQQFPSAPQELQQVYEQNLAIYEQAYFQRQQALKSMAGQQGQMGAMGQQMSPTRPQIPGSQNNVSAQQEYLQQLQRSQEAMKQQQQQRQSATPMQQTPQPQQFDPATQPQHSTPLQSNAALPTMNGHSTPQPDSSARKSMSRQLEGTPSQAREPSQALASPAKPGEPAVAAETALIGVEDPEKRKPVIENEDGTRVYQPAYRTQDTWGGLDFDSDNFKNMIETIVTYKPNHPLLNEMGAIDIRALTMSLRSGLHAETRLALDTLTRITYENTIQFDLSLCEDLTDVLVDLAEEQLEILGNDNPEVTDILDLTPYEDVLHHCRAEAAMLQDLPQAGTKEYTLDRTADRLLAITTIFRNLSFLEVNHASLVSFPVLKFLSNFIRLVGTRVLLLRSHINTFDFMKDVITFFSNTGAKIVLPSREDAYAVLSTLR